MSNCRPYNLGPLMNRFTYDLAMAVEKHCPEGFRGSIEYRFEDAQPVVRLVSDGIDGVVTTAMGRPGELRDFVELGFRRFPFEEIVIKARDHLMQQTLP